MVEVLSHANMNYIAYSDESHITAHQHRSISVMSFAESASPSLHAALDEALRTSNVSEFKWKKLDSAKYRHCALKMVDALMKNLATWDVRIYTIVWIPTIADIRSRIAMIAQISNVCSSICTVQL